MVRIHCEFRLVKFQEQNKSIKNFRIGKKIGSLVSSYESGKSFFYKLAFEIELDSRFVFIQY